MDLTKTKVEDLVAICKHDRFALSITKGNEYEVIRFEDNKVFIKDDNGRVISYYKNRFDIKEK